MMIDHDDSNARNSNNNSSCSGNSGLTVKFVDPTCLI